MIAKSEFKDRLAVVTGASSGIGLALCTALLQRGARVLDMPRSLGGLSQLIETYLEHLHRVSGDVTTTERASPSACCLVIFSRLRQFVQFQLSEGARGVFGQDWVVDNGYTIQ